MINYNNRQRRQQNEIDLLEKESYLLCLHVRPTTIFCGFVILFMSFTNILILLSKFTIEFNPQEKENSEINSLNLDPRFKTNKLIILFIIAESLKLLISSLLIYGVTRCKPSYLIPFFLMQLFYFFRAISYSLESYASYQNNNVYRSDFYEIQRNKFETQPYPTLFFFLSLLYKFYYICCVFKCYKYLKIKEAIQVNQNIQFRHHLQPVNATISVLHHQNSPPSYNDCLNDVRISKYEYDYNEQKLPTYEEATCKVVVDEQIKNEPTNSIEITSDNLNISNNKSSNTQV